MFINCKIRRLASHVLDKSTREGNYNLVNCHPLGLYSNYPEVRNYSFEYGMCSKGVCPLLGTGFNH